MQEQLQFSIGTPLHATIWFLEQLMPLWLCTSVFKYLRSQKFVSCKPCVLGLWHHIHTKLNHWRLSQMLLWPGMPYCRVVVLSVRRQVGKCARISGQWAVIFVRHIHNVYCNFGMVSHSVRTSCNCFCPTGHLFCFVSRLLFPTYFSFHGLGLTISQLPVCTHSLLALI